jgi:hypothetical protein
MGWKERRHGEKRIAAFRPKEVETVRPELLPLIGEVAEWRWAGQQGDDDKFPGQAIWNTDDARFQGYWVPDEDLEDGDIGGR